MEAGDHMNEKIPALSSGSENNQGPFLMILVMIMMMLRMMIMMLKLVMKILRMMTMKPCSSGCESEPKTSHLGWVDFGRVQVH